MSKGEISITDLMTTFEGLQTTITNMAVDLPKAAGDLLVNSVVSASEKIKEIYRYLLALILVQASKSVGDISTD